MRKLLAQIDQMLSRGESFVLASIVDQSGSTPRGKGAYMLISSDHQITGTVGGGLLEARVREMGARVWLTKVSVQERLVLSGEGASVSDMICGGSVDVLVEWVDANRVDCCVALKAMREAVQSLGVAAIFGAGHVSKALAELTHLTNFYTVIIDDRAEYANAERFPLADQILTPNRMDEELESMRLTDDAYIVIVTRGHLLDKVVLNSALKTPATYIGMIGSRRKCALIFDELRRTGWRNEDLARVHAPIGIPIAAETPEEIAVSIIAEMIQHRANKAALTTR